MPRKYTKAEKIAIIEEANDAMPGRLYDWTDFEKYVHDHHGVEGLSYSVLYRGLKDSGFVDIELGQQVRKRLRS